MFAKNVLYELRHALRTVRRHPGFATAAILSLGFGIGASTAIFSVVNAALLRDLPARNPHELVEVTGHRARQRGPGRASAVVSYPMFQDLRARQQVLTDMYASAYLLRRPVVGSSWQAERLAIAPVSGNFFATLGLTAQVGRLLTPMDDQAPGGADASVAVLSDRFWKQQFARDFRVMGTTLQIGQRSYAVVGVAPRAFTGDTPGSSPDIWLPLTAFLSREELEERGGSSIAIIGRLRPGITAEVAAAALSNHYRDLLSTESRTSEFTAVRKGTAIGDYSIGTRPASRGFDALSGRFTRPLMILTSMVLLLLLISCCNFASLLLARARADQLGVALRSALGATRSRLLGRSLAEALMMAVIGIIVGVFIAWAMGRALLAVVALGRDPITLDVTPDGRVLALGVLLGLATSLIFGFGPAWIASRAKMNQALRQHGNPAHGGRAHRIFGRGLVIGQIAISLVLAFATSLMVKTVANLDNVNSGFDARDVLVVEATFDADENREAIHRSHHGLAGSLVAPSERGGHKHFRRGCLFRTANGCSNTSPELGRRGAADFTLV